MGNRIFHYFLNWVEIHVGPHWAHEHIEGWTALGSPFLGAPKVLRTLFSGDAMGLELILQPQEVASLCRRLGSMPVLMPQLHDLLGLGGVILVVLFGGFCFVVFFFFFFF